MNNEHHKFLTFKCKKALKNKSLDTTEYNKRLDYELGVIDNLKYSPYFLVVADFMNWAEDNDILTSPGRGSGAGSLCCFLLNITKLDPIVYGLYFERFLNPERVSPPDLDLDFEANRRAEVIQYVTNKYGQENISAISTYGSLKSKGAIKACARGLGFDYTVGDKLSKLTLPVVAGFPPSLEECYKEVPELAQYKRANKTAEGITLYWADQVEDRIDHAGVHAAGILIGDRPLAELIPLAVRNKIVCAEWDKDEVEKAGLIKFDFLGLTILDVISHALKLIKQRHDQDIDIYNLPLDDKKVFNTFQSGDLIGVFQFETSQGIRDLTVKTNPKTIYDLSTINAVYRPGPMSSNYFPTWLDIRGGKQDPEYLIPELEPTLKETDSFLVYQEQAMQMAIHLAGYTAPEADNLRKIIGKKLPEKMKTERLKFVAGMVKKKFSKNVAEKIFNDIEGFGQYGFNKSHSLAYAYIAYQTAYLKTHYMVEYMCAALTCNQKDLDQVLKYFFDCKEHGIKVLPPDINKSDFGFTIENESTIRFGIKAIKNIGAAANLIIKERKRGGSFVDFLDFINRIDLSKVNKTKLNSLILAGAFDYTGTTRASKLNIVEQALQYKNFYQRYLSKLETYEKKIIKSKERSEEIALKNISGEKHTLKPFKDAERPNEPEKPVLLDIPEILDEELFANERELLGFYVSGHPVNLYNTWMVSGETISNVKSTYLDGDKVRFVAIPTIISERTTKKSGKKMANVLLEDPTGAIPSTFFPKVWEESHRVINLKKPCIINGRIAMSQTDGNSIIEIVITNIETITKKAAEIQNPTASVKLSIDNINKVKELIDKNTPGTSRINLSFQGETLKAKIKEDIKVKDVSTFLRELK